MAVSTTASSPTSTPSASPAPTTLSRSTWSWTDRGMRDLFPTITTQTWSDFKLKRIDEFVHARIRGTRWVQHWDSVAVTESAAFRAFEEQVVEECAWLMAVTGAIRRKVLLKLTYNGVQRMKEKDTQRKHQRKTVEVGGETGGEIARRGESEAGSEPAIKREDSLVSDFISISALAEDSVPATSLHLRLSRRLGSIHPTLCYQTKLDALTSHSYAFAKENLFEWLDFEKLDTAAKLYLGFNINDELLAIDYGAEHKPEWLFIQDDASFRSTIETWHMQHPKTRIVEVLLFDRPGFIPYRTVKDLESGKAGEQDEDELGSGDDEEDDDEMEDVDEKEEGKDNSDDLEKDGDGKTSHKDGADGMFEV